MILSKMLLNPVIHNIQNPLASIVEQIENWLVLNDSEFLKIDWPKAKYAYIQRLLGVKKNGALLRGFSQRASSTILSTTLLDLYELLDNSIYFTSKYWRAFFYYLRTGNLNECWPQFGQKEVDLIYATLSEQDILHYKEKAKIEYKDMYSDAKYVDMLFKRLKQPLRLLCQKKINYFKYDVTIDLEELEHFVIAELIKMIRKHDYMPRDENKIIGWLLKCSDNIIYNLKKALMSDKRRVLHSNEDEETSGSKLRVYSLDQKYETMNQDISGISISDTFVGNDSDLFNFAKAMEDNLLVGELLTKADKKISSYLKVVCCGEYDPDFWDWFRHQEPTLAEKIAYLDENPEALAPFVQRHLSLSTYQITEFLKEHLPDIFLKLDTPENHFRFGVKKYGT